jgi:LysR family positive regulator for ilvC
VVVDNSPVKERIQLLTDSSIAPFDLGLCCYKKKLDDPIVAEFVAMAYQP